MNRCPCCDGSRRVGHSASRHPSMSSPCHLCGGAGEVTDLVLARVDQGRQLSRVRVQAGITLRELARQARLNPTVLSDVEQGRAEASESLKAIYARVAAS